MAGAMKKLKLLHHLSTSATPNTTPSDQASSTIEAQQKQADRHSHHHHHHHHHKLPTTPPSSSSSPNSKPAKKHHQYTSKIPVAAATTSTATTPPQNSGNPTPPVSPSASSAASNSPPKQCSALNHSQKYYAEMLRSARNALHTLQHHHHHHHPHPPTAAVQQQQQRFYQAIPETSAPPTPAVPQPQQHHQQIVQHQQQQQQQQKRHPALPGGFMVLTSEDSHPAICIPASPVPQAVQPVTRSNACLIPPISVNPTIQQLPSAAAVVTRSQPTTPTRSSKRKPPPLTKNAVEMITQDTRVARWQRVLGYVREQRKLAISEQADNTTTTGAGFLDSPYAEIEKKNELLGLLDKDEEVRARSLWSGGSAGTNGVDEFVWDDDEEGFAGDEPLAIDGGAMNQITQQQQQESSAVATSGEKDFMREDEVKKAIEDHKRRYQRPGKPEPEPPAQVQVTPPQLKAYTTFLRDRGFYDQRQSRQTPGGNTRHPTSSSNHTRNLSAGSNNNPPPASPSTSGFKRQAIGRGIIPGRGAAGHHGKTGSFGSSSVEGAIFKMDGDHPTSQQPHYPAVMEIDSHHTTQHYSQQGSTNLPLPSSFFRQNPPITPQQQLTTTAAPSSSRRSRSASTANLPLPASPSSPNTKQQRRSTYPPVLTTTTSTTTTSYGYGQTTTTPGPAYAGYRSPTISSMRKAQSASLLPTVPSSPKVAPLSPLSRAFPVTGGSVTAAGQSNEKGLREYIDALRRYEVRNQVDMVHGHGYQPHHHQQQAEL